jgi:hypothetical protein
VFSGSLESGGPFCIGVFGTNVALFAVNMFSRLTYLEWKCYKFCILVRSEKIILK